MRHCGLQTTMMSFHEWTPRPRNSVGLDSVGEGWPPIVRGSFELQLQSHADPSASNQLSLICKITEARLGVCSNTARELTRVREVMLTKYLIEDKAH